jgi:hypothetical protein
MIDRLTTEHTPMTCRWSRLGYRLAEFDEADQPESLWVCVRRTGIRRALTNVECAQCEFWESMDGSNTRIAEAYTVPRWRLQCE